MMWDTVLNGATIYATGSHRLVVHTHVENLPHKNSYPNVSN